MTRIENRIEATGLSELIKLNQWYDEAKIKIGGAKGQLRNIADVSAVAGLGFGFIFPPGGALWVGAAITVEAIRRRGINWALKELDKNYGAALDKIVKEHPELKEEFKKTEAHRSIRTDSSRANYS